MSGVIGLDHRAALTATRAGHAFTDQALVDALAALRLHVDESQEAELARVMAQLGHLDEHDREVVRQFGERMVDKMFHHLVSRVREVWEHESADEVLDLLMQLFADTNAPAEK